LPGIKKPKSVISIVEDEDDFDSPGHRIMICPHCIEFGITNPLHHKILQKGEKPARDYNEWCSCLACGKTFPRHSIKTEAILSDALEVIDNPFDQGKNIVGLGNKLKKNSHERERQKLLDRIEEEKDPEIRAELRKGNAVEIIE
jgi:hypothetical protein